MAQESHGYTHHYDCSPLIPSSHVSHTLSFAWAPADIFVRREESPKRLPMRTKKPPPPHINKWPSNVREKNSKKTPNEEETPPSTG